MIFKTFDSDIDKISAKWGIFGKSFNEIGTAITGRISDINKGFQATDDLLGAFKDTDSIWKRLYPSKETIQSQMIDIDALYPEIDDSVAQKILNDLTQQQKLIDTTKGSWNDYFKEFQEGDKWQIEFVQNTDLQKASIDDVKKSYENARQSALAHNAALKQQTLSAKASELALKGLALAGNMLVMWGVTVAIQSAVKWIDTLTESIEEQKEALEEHQNTVKEYESQISSLQSKLDENQAKIDEINSNPLDIVDENTLSTLQAENTQLTEQLNLVKALNEEAKQLAQQKLMGILNNTAETTGMKEILDNLQNGDVSGLFGSYFGKNGIYDGFADGYEDFQNGNFFGGVKGISKGVWSIAGSANPIGGIANLYNNFIKPKKENELSPTEEVEEQISKVAELRQQLKDLEAEQNNYSNKDEYTKKYNKLNEELTNTTTSLVDNVSTLKGYQSQLDATDPEQATWIQNIQDTIDQYTALMTTKPEYDTFDDIINSDVYGGSKDALIELAKQGSLTEEVLDEKYHDLFVLFNALGLNIDDVINKFKELGTETDAPEVPVITPTFDSVFNSSDFAESKEALLELAKAGTISPEVLTSTEEYKNLLKETGLSAEEATKEIIKMCGELDYTDLMSGLSDSIGVLIGAEKEMEENGVVAFSTVQKMLELYPELEDSLVATSAGYTLTTDAIEAQINAQTSHYELIYNEALDAANKLMQSQFGVANSYATTTEEIRNQIQAQMDSIRITQTMLSAQATKYRNDGTREGYERATRLDEEVLSLQDQFTALYASLVNVNSADVNLNKYKEVIDQLRIDKENSSSKSSSKDNTDYWKEAFEKELADLQYKRDMELISEEQYYSSLKALNDKYFKGKEKYLEDYRKYEVEIYDYTSGLHKKEFEDKLADLKHALEMNEITEAQYYKTLNALNQEYFANNAKYLEEYEQYTEEVYKGMLSVQEDALESINDLIDLRIDMIKDLKEKEIKAHEETLEAEKEKLEAINKQIGARKEAIELMKDEKSHSEEMTEKNKVISDLQVQIDRLSLDTSASAQKKRRELQEQLVEAQKDLTDYISDYEYDKAMEALDNEAENAEKEYEIFEEEINDKIEAIETFLDDEKLLLSTAMSELDGMNNTIFENMKTWAMETTGEVQNIVDTWKEAQKALELYNGTFDVAATKTALEQANSEKKVIDKVNTGSGNKSSNNVPVTSTVPTQPVVKQPTQPTSTKSGGDGIPKQGDKATFSSGKYYGTSWGEGASGSYNLGKQVYITSVNEKGTHPYHISTSPTLGNGDLGWVKLNQLKGYAKGTLGTHKDELSWVDENGDEIIIRAGKTGRLDYLTKGTSVIPADISKNLIEWGKIPPTAFKFDIPDYSSMVKNVSNNNESTVVNIGDIIIQGNAGNLTKSDLNLFKDDIVNKVYASLQKNRVKSGRY